MEDQAAPNTTGQTFGPYQIQSKLGQGGMGAVYLARDSSLERFVALKILPGKLAADTEYVARFRREAVAAAQLDHPNIVRVFAAGESDGTHYIAMELVEGQTLHGYLAQWGPMQPVEALGACMAVAKALDYAWNRSRIIHRDIKPANIFISSEGEVKLGDLGLVKRIGGESTELTQSGVTVGTPHYCSPEQARGEKDIDFRSDIYSLGCTLYHLLSGHMPYEGGAETSPVAIMVKHVTDPPPQILQVLPACPPPVVLLLDKMLAKHPTARHQSYGELIQDLQRIIAQLQSGAAAPVASAVAATAPRSVEATMASRKFSPALICAVAGVAAAAVLAGVWWWSPWKERSAGILPADSRTSQQPEQKPAASAATPFASEPATKPAVAPTPSTASQSPSTAPASAAASLPAPASSEAALQKLGNVFTNAVGAEMVYIPPGEFMMGSTKEEQEWAVALAKHQEKLIRIEGEQPRKATIRNGFWLGRTEVTVGQWKRFVAATGYVTDGEKNGESTQGNQMVRGASWGDPKFGSPPKDNDPVCCVSWNDAMAFCEWLKKQERGAGRLSSGHTVRLPTEAEWEYACRAGTQTKFWWGDSEKQCDDRLNCAGLGDGFNDVSPVDHYGLQGRNQFGLADMLGNVREWCLDKFDPNGAHEELWTGNLPSRVARGGTFFNNLSLARCACRVPIHPSASECSNGFRVCYGVDMTGVTTTTASTSPAVAANETGILAPPETRVPALTANPKVGEVFTLNVGSTVTMELMGIPPGEFMLGSTKEEQAWAMANGLREDEFDFVKREGEAPRKATIKQGFWMGRTEVTLGQWKQFVKETGYVTDGEKKGESYAPQPSKRWAPKKGVSWRNPDFGFEMRDDHAVSCISWNDAKAFCEWLDKHEQRAGRLVQGYAVRLPTEAEWEYACRAGTQTKFWWGESIENGAGRLNRGWMDDGHEFVAPVDSYGARGRNRFGLADMLGNVMEWCLDKFDATQAHGDLWTGDAGMRLLRGGSFNHVPVHCRCSSRLGNGPTFSSGTGGFRVCVGVNLSSVRTLTPATSAAITAEDPFPKEVAGLPADQQLARVIAKLKELNPQFDNREQHKIEGGQVTELSFSTIAVKDISPLRALKGLKKLTLLPWVAGGARPPGALSDLSPLQGLPLTFLACGNTQVSDLAPLKGMPLTILSVDGTQVSDISPLEGMPLTILWCDKAKVTDLSPLARVSGPLKELRCDFVPERDAAVLRGIKTLEKINNVPAAAFWAKAGPASVAAVSDRRNLPATDGAQRAPLQTANKVDPVYAARLTPQTRAAAVQRFGGTPASEAAVTRALEWLKTKQSSDGCWGGQCKTAMTGFALLAYLARGETEASQLYAETITKGIKWLANIDQPQSSHTGIRNIEYQHPIATMALCEAYALTQNAALLPALEKAIALIIKSQCSNGSWDYGYNTKGRNTDNRPGGDTSISSWNIQALKAAQRAGVKAPGLNACLPKALDFLSDVQDSKTGRFGYSVRGGGSDALLGAGSFCLHLLGAGNSKEARGALSALRVVKCDWAKATEASTYGWYYATCATFHAGGSHWVSWNREFRDEIVKRQNADGSWAMPGSGTKEAPKTTRGTYREVPDAQDAAVYHTVVMTLMLESYYRFAPPAW